MKTRTITMKLLPALIATTFAGSASAAGFQLLEQTASGIGNAYAGSAAVAENASTIFYNPAGMTQLKDHEASLGLTMIKPSFKFHNDGTSVGVNNSSGGDAGQYGYVPNGYLSWKLTDQWYAGLGLGAPFGLMTSYDTPWTGSAQSNKFDVKTYNVNPSLAWKMNDQVSLGAGLNWQRLTAEYQRQFSALAAVPVAPGVTLPGGTPLTLNVDDNAFGWNVGALIKVVPATKLGLSYRSKIHYSASGTVTGGSPIPQVNAVVGSNVKADITLPDTFIASLTHQLDDRWELLGDISWTGWSSISKIDIVNSANGALVQSLGTNFRNTWRVALGTNYKLNDAWKLKAGVAYDQTPVKGADTRLASLPDNDRIWLSLGAQWKATQNSTLDVGAAYLFLRDADIHNNQSTPQGIPQGALNGTYKDSGWLLGVQYSINF